MSKKHKLSMYQTPAFKLGIGFIILLFIFSAFYSDAQTKKQLNAILISWDGVQYEHLKECLNRKELPNLQEIIDKGSFIPMWVYHVTDTKAGHSEMLSGYPPEVTGVYSNSNFKPVPDGYSIFSRLEHAYGDDNIVTVMLTGKSNHIGSLGPNESSQQPNLLPRQQPALAVQLRRLIQRARLDSAQIAVLRQIFPNIQAGIDTTRQNLLITNPNGEPWYFEKNKMDVWDGDKQRNAGEVGPKAMHYIEQYKDKRFFMFFHFSDPDTKGHQSGENSQDYTDAIIACDVWLGEIADALNKNKLYDKTMIYVTTDHGFNEGTNGHNFAPDIWLASTDKGLFGPGAQGDIVPTLLSRFEIAVNAIQPTYPGHNLFTQRDVPLKPPERTIRRRY